MAEKIIKGPFNHHEMAQKGFEKLTQLWPHHVCDVCHKDDWNVPETIVTPQMFSMGTGIQIGGKAFPSLMAICLNCGNTKFFNLVALGVVDTQEVSQNGDR